MSTTPHFRRLSIIVKGRIKFGMYGPFYPLEHIFSIARSSEKYGFNSFWLGDHLAAFPTIDAIEVWSVLASLATITKNIKLGTSVSDPHRRHPAVFAQTVTACDVISGGRIILGIGPGEAMNLNQYGIDWSTPVSKMEEFIIVSKKFWTGKPVTFSGKFYNIKEGALLPRPVQKPHPPIWVGSNKPRTYQITGRVGDGWLPLVIPPEFYKEDLETIRMAAKKVGRKTDEIEAGLFLYIMISEDYDKAKQAIEEPTKRCLAWLPDRLERMGYKKYRKYTLSKKLDMASYLVTKEKDAMLSEAMKIMPFEAVERTAVFGPLDDCIRKIEDYIQAGVTHFVLVPIHAFGDLKEWKRNVRLCGEKILPYFSEAH